MKQDLSRVIDALAGDLPVGELFRLIAESIGAPIAILTPDHRVESANRHCLDYVGMTLEELKDRATAGVVHPNDLPSVLEAVTRSVTTGEGHHIEYRLRRADGAWRWVSVRAAAIRDREDRVLRWFSLLTDFHDRREAEDAIRASINAIPVMAWSAHPDGSAEWFNPNYLDYVGMTQEQARGSGWTAAVHPDDLPGLLAAWQECLGSENAGEAEARLRRYDGQYRWFLFRTNPLRNESGHIVEWYGSNTDIDDRKRAEIERARSEEALRFAHSHLTKAQRLSQTGSFTGDMTRDEHVWSDEFYRICEIEPGSKITLQRIKEVMHPEDVPDFHASVERMMKGEDVERAFRIVTARGVVKHLRCSAQRMPEFSDRPVLVGAVQDVTASKVADDALSRARAELTRVSRIMTLGALTASIAHEINQPLSGIVTNAGACLRMLATDPPDLQGVNDTVRRTIRDARRASDVVTRLRALFANKPSVTEAVDLNEATREVIAMSRGDLQRSGVILQMELYERLPPVTGDRIQLQQVVLNLLLNAAEAMSEVDDRPRELRVKTDADEEGNVRLSVRDSGVGIAPQDANQLFEAFYTTKRGGMGMGLSVSRSIIESHRGRLWAVPNDGPGATFSFSLPRGPAIGPT